MALSRLNIVNPCKPTESVILNFTDESLCFAVSWDLRALGYSVVQSDNYNMNESRDSAIDTCEIFLGKPVK